MAACGGGAPPHTHRWLRRDRVRVDSERRDLDRAHRALAVAGDGVRIVGAHQERPVVEQDRAVGVVSRRAQFPSSVVASSVTLSVASSGSSAGSHRIAPLRWITTMRLSGPAGPITTKPESGATPA